MGKRVLVFPLVALLIFAIGYVWGQSHAPTHASAAQETKSLVVSGHTSREIADLPLGRFSWEHAFGGPRVFGKVTSISGNTVTVRALMPALTSIFTIKLTDSTKFYRGRLSGTTRALLKVGSYISARGMLSSDGKQLTATAVVILPKPLFGLGRLVRPFAVAPSHLVGPLMRTLSKSFAAGKVTAVRGEDVTLEPLMYLRRKTGPRFITVYLTPKTEFKSTALTSSSRSAVMVGSYLIAHGTLSPEGTTFSAVWVAVTGQLPDIQGHILPRPVPGPGFGLGRGLGHFFGRLVHRAILPLGGSAVRGIVESIAGNRLMIHPGVGPSRLTASVTTVILNGKTQYMSAAGVTASRPAIKSGEHIFATGKLLSDGQRLIATRLMPVPGFRSLFGGFGRFMRGVVPLQPRFNS